MYLTDETDGLWCVWLERATGAAWLAVLAVGVYFLAGGGR